MNLMPLPFEEFEGKGVLDLSSSSCSPDSLKPSINYKWEIQEAFEEKWWYVQSSFLEPSSVLEPPTRPRSPLSSSSTMSSSQGAFFTPPGSGSDPRQTTTTTSTTPGVSASNPSPVDTQKCGQPQQQQLMGVEDWESVLSIGGNNGSSSPGQDHSILRLIMGDVEDPSLGLSKLLQGGVGVGVGIGIGPHHPELVDFSTTSTTTGGGGAGFGLVDQVFNFEPISTPPSGNNDPTSSLHGDLSSSASPPDFPPPVTSLGRMGSILSQIPNTNPVGFPAGLNLNPGVFQQPVEDEKPQVFNPLIITHPNQAHFPQNPALFLPLPYPPQLQEHHHMLSPPPSKRVHLGPAGIQAPFSDSSRAELFLQRQQQQQQLQMLQQQQRPPLISNCSTNNVMPMKQKFDELGNANTSSGSQQLQQAIVNPICQAAELTESGNPVLAQGILARLNHQLSLPIGKPSHRAAFYFKEALQLLLHLINTNSLNTNPTNLSPCSLFVKIGAYKSFSEISPILQFANFTCNQALLEKFEGFDRIHVVDFDLGYGGQWASLMQELALRNGGAPSLKITAFASPFSLDELELSFTQENLKIFAREISMPFELEILSLDSLSSGSWPMMPSSKEVVAVNLPVTSFSSFPASLPLVLRLVKQLSPKIVVSLDRACDRFDLPFAHHVNQAIQSYSTLLESLDAVNANPDALQKIERFLVQPGIEKLVLGRHRCPDRIATWRSLFLQSGFTPLTFSNFTESQAECLVQRTPIRGFHVEKRQSSLILFWQRKELISASTWRC